jgi:hypothetical protein
METGSQDSLPTVIEKRTNGNWTLAIWSDGSTSCCYSGEVQIFKIARQSQTQADREGQ